MTRCSARIYIFLVQTCYPSRFRAKIAHPGVGVCNPNQGRYTAVIIPLDRFSWLNAHPGSNAKSCQLATPLCIENIVSVRETKNGEIARGNVWGRPTVPESQVHSGSCRCGLSSFMWLSDIICRFASCNLRTSDDIVNHTFFATESTHLCNVANGCICVQTEGGLQFTKSFG